MEWMELHCRLEKCELDGSTAMDLGKCCATGGKLSPCLHLATRKKTDARPGDVWDKLSQMIEKDKKREAKEKDKERPV